MLAPYDQRGPRQGRRRGERILGKQPARCAGHYDSSAAAGWRDQQNLNEPWLASRRPLSPLPIEIDHALGDDVRLFQVFQVAAAAIDADLPIEIAP
jgi:hypothetical protein